MPRNMSFALTTEQFKRRTKTVTRRVGWVFLKPGDVVNGCVKCMGLKPGESIERLGQIRIIDVRREPLDTMKRMHPAWGRNECVLEGFPDMTPAEFVAMFRASMRCDETEVITRIAFEYIDPPHHNQPRTKEPIR